MSLFRILFLIVGVAVSIETIKAEEGTVCARVELQIEQELTFEREGFEARLGINNGTADLLDDLSITLRFADAAGNPVEVVTGATPPVNPSALFYYRYNGPGTVPTQIVAGSSAKITHLIVPAPNSAHRLDPTTNEYVEVREGRLYYVGATIRYTQNDQPVVVEVQPDFITVRPMPKLELEYFLPGDVYADDPNTLGVTEPTVPFRLGVRVLNHSEYSPANELKILSGQPKITENTTGLLVDFKILSAEVNGFTEPETLLLGLGEVAPRKSGTGAWWMTASLSGRFISFNGEVSHAPEFGGAVTSLIPQDAIKTYKLLGRVRVDFPAYGSLLASDSLPDFLATSFTDATSVTVHESDNDQSGSTSAPKPSVVKSSSANLISESGGFRLNVGDVAPATTAPGRFFLYVQMPIAVGSDKIVTAIRLGSNGKILPEGNAWISKTKDGANWVYSLHLFDSLVGPQVNLAYSLALSEPAAVNQPPVIRFSRSSSPVSGTVLAVQGSPLEIGVQVADDGPASRLVLETGALPVGASYVPGTGAANGVFDWSPTAGQLGDYYITFRAQDGEHTTTRTLSLKIVASLAGGYAAWAQNYWPGETRDSVIGYDADPDHDDLSNLLEYALKGDPTVPDDSILPRIGSTEVSGQKYLTLTYQHRTDDTALAIEVVGASSAFATGTATGTGWSVQNTILAQTLPPHPNDMKSVTIRDSVAITPGTPRRYLRLQVTRQE